MPIKYLITGISGFVAGHFIEYLLAEKTDVEIYGICQNVPNFSFLSSINKKKIQTFHFSLLNRAAIERILIRTKPDFIIHLAANSSVAYSWTNPADSFLNNTNIFLNIIEAVRNTGINTRILSVGSSEEYGSVSEVDLPIGESTALHPTSPYAVARVSQEFLSKIYFSGYGIPIICTRSFNHVGPRQPGHYVVSSFVKQSIEIKNGNRTKLTCGNISLIRDFIDVRDVVRAYDCLLDHGKPGDVYNICSGKGQRLSDIIIMLNQILGINVDIETDVTLLRPIDNPIVIGSNKKLLNEFEFTLKYDIFKSLVDICEYWQNITNK